MLCMLYHSTRRSALSTDSDIQSTPVRRRLDGCSREEAPTSPRDVNAPSSRTFITTHNHDIYKWNECPRAVATRSLTPEHAALRFDANSQRSTCASGVKSTLTSSCPTSRALVTRPSTSNGDSLAVHLGSRLELFRVCTTSCEHRRLRIHISGA